ncbi:lysophospholipid acyltransferase 6 isoform X1 [Drosophila nasuta]|uniref:Lysophospholipid acyltransferase 6 isoform X1 n=1 Tax=Drosophila albomicans TaxID=7291 RepID=A0A6P8YJX5_DROAB|nr:lysophospholipid acyltransferase 6 isoform X1 [Drosophila albomicans]XP_060657986.1 lysophospholipid acyltransferase 6 isoform X1 [Drosophila nasuta]
MLESPTNIESSDCYDGSRIFTWLADMVGLSVDLVNFLICQISALFLASLFRSFLHPSKVSCEVRHAFGLSLGLTFGYFCFGQQAIHIAGLPLICYIVIRTQDPRIVQRSVMLVAMGYLLCVHLMRQFYDYGSYALDITGPLMIITQKVTSLAFSIHDGFVRKDEDMTKAQQYHAIRKMPSALEYFSYVWHFQSLMAGPLVFYKDYIEFVEGYNLLKRPASNASLDNGKSELVVEPSPTKTVIRKVLGSLVCAFIFMKFVKIYPVKNMKDDDFVNGTSIPYKFWYAMMATTCIRFKYYHAWLLADAICNNSGLGFTGYDKDGNAKWDLISNINVLSFEFASNMRDAISNWNCGTNRWLRTLVYERVPKKYGTLLTFTLSAVWHGFYPGYYLTFATGALMVTAARTARRMFRHRFQSTQVTRMFYDILTCITTRIVMGYATFPFVLLEFMGSIKLYLRFFLCLHLISLVTIFILPKFIRGEPRTQRSSRSSAGANVPVSTQSDGNITAAVDQPLAVAASTDDLNANDEKEDGVESKHAKRNNDTMPQQQQQQSLQHDLKQNQSPILQPRPQLLQQQQSPKPIQHHNGQQICARDAVSVPHDQCEMDQLSSKLKEKIEAETKNIEEFIDKTVTETVSGIVEFKNDLMRDIEFPKLKLAAGSVSSGAANLVDAAAAGLRKRNISSAHDSNSNNTNNTNTANACADHAPEENSGAFLKKEIDAINAVVQQANVLPAVLSNGHAK